MKLFPVYVLHSGECEENKFINFVNDCVIIESTFSYNNLVAAISEQIRIDCELNTLEINFLPKDGLPPILIYNDTCVKVYIELKKKHLNFTEYQLYVTVKEIYDNRLVGTSSSCLVARSSNCIDVSTIDSTEIMPDIEFIENTKFSENTGIIDDMLNEFVEEDQVYKDKETVVSVMKNLAVRERFQFKVKRSSATRYHLMCVNDNCAWSFKSSAVYKANIFKVRSYNNNHTCGYGERYLTQRQAISGVIASIVKDKYVNPKKVYTANDIIEDIQKQQGIEVSYMKAWRAKEIAMAMIRGNPSDSYKELPRYLYMLEHTNPGTVIKLHKSEDGCFLYAYISLYASIKGWEHCRPIMVVDGSFLKAAYKGTILTACTQEGAGKILPLAYAIVDSENNKSWEWFFVQIKGTFGNVKRTFKKHHKQLKDIFFSLARAYTIEKFDYHMTEMCKIDPRVQPYLFEIGYERWSRAYSKVKRFEIGYERWSRAYSKVKRSMVLTSNIAESMNAANKDARELPVMRLLEYMTNLLQQWNNKNIKSAMETSTELGEKYDKILRENLIASEQMKVRPATEQLYTMLEGVRGNIVCLEEGTCSCDKFQMNELPCPHAWAVLKNQQLKPGQYCSFYYKKDNLLKTYEIPVNPMPDESLWVIPIDVLEDVVLPPKGRRNARRPRKERLKPASEKESKRAFSCSVCGQSGHNRKTCRNRPK
ncbi:PREDICTED: uncharacterized protein LOC109215262 [Nicotiana attenuata]|uniref:uncharacterized protein LOC109215262 n=1 Tax=Nicotiana attenuata TaxID=49451 RepID=UPI000904C560|nr:PREDICTED: uncharacterized protein LOC109215262 [Nicotiana attenuata]